MPHPEDFEKLRASAEALARRMVDEHGMSAPFAIVVQADGVLRTIAGTWAGDESPRSVELMAGLVKSLRERRAREDFRAVALCMHGYIAQPDGSEKAHSILISLESRNGQAWQVIIPYVQGLFKSVCYHDAMEQPGRLSIFAP